MWNNADLWWMMLFYTLILVLFFVIIWVKIIKNKPCVSQNAQKSTYGSFLGLIQGKHYGTIIP